MMVREIFNVLKEDKNDFTKGIIRRQQKMAKTGQRICLLLVIIMGIAGAILTFILEEITLYTWISIIGVVLFCGIAYIFADYSDHCEKYLKNEQNDEIYQKLLFSIKQKKFSELILMDPDLIQEIFQQSLENGSIELKSESRYIVIKTEDRRLLVSHKDLTKFFDSKNKEE